MLVSSVISFVSVRGRYLYNEDGTRFFMKGIAFPVPYLPLDYDESAWIGILRQLKLELKLDINTVRVYRMDPAVDYSGFFDEAASLGIYVLVPLTSAMGHGVLDRTEPAPHCYNRQLFEYGAACLDNYMQVWH
jgi:1,3-beta-glucanosyltransferase GAS1